MTDSVAAMTDITPDDPSVGDQVDAKLAELRSELNDRIDELQATVAELSAKLDQLQG